MRTSHAGVSLKAVLLAFIVGIVLLLAVGFATPYYMLGLRERSQIRLYDGAEVGRSRSEVVRHLGKPWKVLTTRQDYEYLRNDHGYVPTPPYPMEHEVLVYVDYIWRLYVYVDTNDRVTHVHMCRT